MTHCQKCNGLLLINHGEIYCFACGARPLEPTITEKCTRVDCRALPEKDGYCLPCWNSRIRSEHTPAEREQRRRDRERAYKHTIRKKKREAA